MKSLKPKIILLTTLLVGTIDGVAALAQYYANGGSHVENVFKFIASGIFGFKAFAGEADMVIYGILLHYTIALIWVTIFFSLRPTLKIQWNFILIGAIYGSIIWAVMNLVILPFSNAPAPPNQSAIKMALGIVILIFCVGIPTAFAYHKTTK